VSSGDVGTDATQTNTGIFWRETKGGGEKLTAPEWLAVVLWHPDGKVRAAWIGRFSPTGFDELAFVSR